MKHNFSSNHWIFLETQISRKNSNTAQDRSKREKWSIRSQTPYNLAKWGSIIVFWALIASFYSNVYIVWYNMLEDSGDMGELGHNRAKDFLNSRSYKAMIYKLFMKNSTAIWSVCAYGISFCLTWSILQRLAENLLCFWQVFGKKVKSVVFLKLNYCS